MAVRIRLMEPIPKRNYFLTGFQGIGMVGYLTVQHLSKTLPCRRVGFVEFGKEPPYSAYIVSSTHLSTPGEVYFCPGSGMTLAIVHWDGEFMGRNMHGLARSLSRWVQVNGFRVAILFGGLDNRLRGDDEVPLRVATTTAYRERYSLGNVKLMEMSYAMVGPLALLMNEMERRGVPAIAVLPYAEPFRVDPNAAIVAIKFLNELTGVSVDVSGLREFAEVIERELREMQAMMRREREREGPPYVI